jgi:OmcA/MtrC family decaheme c-type cytochrome
VCHTASSGALTQANAMTVTTSNCFSCHESMESWDFTASGLTFHESMTAATDCTTCHNSTPTGVAPATVTAFHNGLVTERGGIIFNGDDTSVTEGAKFDWQITGIVDNGTNLSISWAAKYNGADVNPCNATAAVGAPVFHAAAGGNLSMLRSYFQGDDPVLGQDPNAPGQALAVNVTTTNTTCTGNVATTVIPVNTGITATRGIVALQGKPRVVTADITTPMMVRAKTPVREWVVGTGALPAQARRAIANSSECIGCHVGSLYQHGGNRVDNVDMCVICHNSASSEQNVRVAMGVTPSEAYDGLIGQTYEFKTMLHAIHAVGGASGALAIYRTRGIYAWAPEGFTPPNWKAGTACAVASPIPPATTPAASVVLNPTTPPAGTTFSVRGNIVFGASTNADGTYPTVACQPHTLYHPTYPRDVRQCSACHVAGFGTIPDQSMAVATTMNAGAAPWNNQLDDTLQGASAAACTSCHSTTDARGHAYQNGWTPQTFPNGRQTILETR